MANCIRPTKASDEARKRVAISGACWKSFPKNQTCFLRTSVTFARICPLFIEKCPLFSEKSPLFFERSPLFSEKSCLFLWCTLRSCASKRNLFMASKTRYYSRDSNSVENCEFHLYSTLSRVRAHVSGQEFIVFRCHICHRNPITHCVIMG